MLQHSRRIRRYFCVHLNKTLQSLIRSQGRDLRHRGLGTANTLFQPSEAHFESSFFSIIVQHSLRYFCFIRDAAMVVTSAPELTFRKHRCEGISFDQNVLNEREIGPVHHHVCSCTDGSSGRSERGTPCAAGFDSRTCCYNRRSSGRLCSHMALPCEWEAMEEQRMRCEW